jgi:hypothetical protein
MGEVSIMLPQYQYKYLVNQEWQEGVIPLPTNHSSLRRTLSHLELSHQRAKYNNHASGQIKQGERNPQPALTAGNSHLSRAAIKSPESSHHLYRQAQPECTPPALLIAPRPK